MSTPNRKQRRAMAAAASKNTKLTTNNAGSLPDEAGVVPRVGDIMTFEREPIALALKCTGVRQEWQHGTAAFDFVPLESTVHPVPLRFPAPLLEHSNDSGKAITYHWEKLTYLFNFPDPAEFPALAIPAEDRLLMAHFIQICEELAGFSAIEHDDQLIVRCRGGGDWSIEAKSPSKEAFVAASVAFRQLHSGQEEA